MRKLVIFSSEEPQCFGTVLSVGKSFVVLDIGFRTKCGEKVKVFGTIQNVPRNAKNLWDNFW